MRLELTRTPGEVTGKKMVGGAGCAGPSTFSSSSCEKKRPHHTTTGQAGAFLPPWITESAGATSSSSSYTLNTSMPSLEMRYNSLKECVPELERGNMAHVSGGCVYCPCMALTGKAIVHKSNGTYVAVVGDALYATCSDRSCTWEPSDGTRKDDDGLLVEGTGYFGHPWVKYTEESYTRLGHNGKKARGHKMDLLCDGAGHQPLVQSPVDDY